MPEISDWNPYEDWEKAGQRDVLRSAHEKCDRILDECEGMVLPAEVDHEIEAYFKAL
jgi:trimethylamine--corrinoid protein Co-methyltransferase